MLGMKYVQVYNAFEILASDGYFDAKRFVSIDIHNRDEGLVEDFLNQVANGEYYKQVDIEDWLSNH
jgi:hypothetical protein